MNIRHPQRQCRRWMLPRPATHRSQTSPAGAGSKVALESMPIDSVTPSDGRDQRERSPSRRISSPHLGVFAVIAAGPGSRRGHAIYSGVFAVAAVTAAGVPCPVRPWLARLVPLRRPELADQLPVGAWCCRAADGPVLELGELGVPDDRRGPDHPGAAMGGARRPAGRRRGGGNRARHRAGTEASGQRLGTVPRRDHRLRRGDRFIGGEVARRRGLQRAHHAGYAPAGPR